MPSCLGGLRLHGGINKIGLSSSRPRTSQIVGAINIALTTLNSAILEHIPILAVALRSHNIATLLAHNNVHFVEEHITRTTDKVSTSTDNATLEIVGAILLI